jgi:hypothetical protein
MCIIDAARDSFATRTVADSSDSDVHRFEKARQTIDDELIHVVGVEDQSLSDHDEQRR